MKRALVIIAALACALALAGCQQSQADVRREAAFAKQCTESGGRVYYVGFASEIIRCDFTTEPGSQSSDSGRSN